MIDGLGDTDDIGAGGLPLKADINVTSLVDVAFVLLIIFMITAPIMQGGVDVDLPKADARPVTSTFVTRTLSRISASKKTSRFSATVAPVSSGRCRMISGGSASSST